MNATMERLYTAGNEFQGRYEKVLCVCSAGILRSATAAVVLAKEPFNCNTRNAGVESYALIPVDQVLLCWADEIVCMEKRHKKEINRMLKEFGYDRRVICLDIPDVYAYRDPELAEMIREKYTKATKEG